MNISILERSSSVHVFRGIGKYTKLVTQLLPELDKQNSYSIISDLKDVKKGCDILVIPDFTVFNISIPIFTKARHIVVTVHDLVPIIYPQHFPAGIKGNIIWQFQKNLLINRVSRIITDSIFSKNDIIKQIPGIKDKISVIYPVVSDQFRRINDTKVLNKIRLKYKLPHAFVLYTGDANWNKNLMTLIKSAKAGKYELFMAGKVFTDSSVDLSHPWNKSLKDFKAFAKGVANIHFLGYVSDSDLVCLYNLASVYVQPSLYEGFGLPVLEALLSGCPVVCSDIGSLREIGSDCVLYFYPNNVDDLTQKINLLMSNEKLRIKNSQKGLQQAKKFTIDQFIKSFHSIYQRIIG